MWRVSDRRSFAVLRAHGTRHRSGPLTMTALVRPDAATPPRVAFAIGRRVGSAVSRNRLRRQLRAAIAELAPRPGDYVITVSPEVAGLSFGDLRHHLASTLRAAGALP